MRRACRWAAILVVGLIATGATESAGALTVAAPSPPGQLYLLQAEGGTLERVPGGWRLTLRDPDATVTSFTDRPARVGSAQRLRRFVAGWARAFAGDPPNAALQLDRAPVGRDVVLLELRRPRFHAAAGTLTFRARLLTSTRRTQLRAIARRADPRVARSFGRASLFIDDGPSSIGYVVTVSVVGPPIGPAVFSLALTNSRFQEDAQIQDTLLFGQGTTPAYTYAFSATALTLGLPAGGSAAAVVPIDLPAGGSTVQATVTLSPGFVALFSSEAGNVEATQSGPIAIPAPPPPG